MWLVIPGSTSGNGLASADRLVAEGASVFITGRRKAALDAAVTEIRENVIGIRGDVANLADHLNLYDKQFGQALSCPPVKKTSPLHPQNLPDGTFTALRCFNQWNRWNRDVVLCKAGLAAAIESCPVVSRKPDAVFLRAARIGRSRSL